MRKAIRHLRQADPILAGIIERVGPCRIQYAEPDFETLARSIVFQQLSGKSARAIFARLKAAAGGADGRMSPEGLLALGTEAIRAIGLSRQKEGYLRDLAERVTAGRIDFARLRRLPDPAVIQHLTAVKGVGVWTAQMFLIFALRRPDVLAVGDLGIRTAVRKAYRMRTLPPPARLERLGARWRPYRSVACWYLWRSLSAPVLIAERDAQERASQGKRR
jgi:DNA-3-methyladenine glycosylase II